MKCCVVIFSLFCFVGYNFPSSPHYYPQKKKERERENNSILEIPSAKVKIKSMYNHDRHDFQSRNRFYVMGVRAVGESLSFLAKSQL